MQIKIIAVGKCKEKYLQAGVAEYEKRLTPYASIQLYEVKEATSSHIAANLEHEKKAIQQLISNNDYIVVCDIDGEMMDSVAFSTWISNHYTYQSKTITFIIGGSDGLDPAIKKQSDKKISFGLMTFPHHLARLILYEQIYRAVMIRQGTKYHK